MNLPIGLTEILEKELGAFLQQPVQVFESHPVSGGCIHNGCRLNTKQGSFFLKYNSPDKAVNFAAELSDLRLLSRGPMLVPATIGTGQMESAAWLLMEWIDSGQPNGHFWENFGLGLAKLHRQLAPNFGLDRSNFIGTLPQFNTSQGNWVDFFIEQRLQPQLKLAIDQRLADRLLIQQFEALYHHLPGLIPEEPPSLLHGDLWSGNFMVDQSASPVLIDPAAYYGHREAEIAFTKLFGGFSPLFYQAYQNAWPMQTGWEKRVDLFNLYPLAVHLNLFGQGYLPEIQSILAQYA